MVLDGIDSFNKAISSNEIILVEFYAPWCGHCKRLEPEYEKAAQELKGTKGVLAKINGDAEHNKPLLTTYGVQAFPTLKLFKKGAQVMDFTGERTVGNIVSFMKRQSKPSLTSVSTADEIRSFSQDEKVVIVGFFPDRTSPEYEQFKKASDALGNDYRFCEVVGNPQVNREYGVTSLDVVILKQFDERENRLGSKNFKDLIGFIRRYAVPIIDEVTPENYRSYVDSGVPLVYIFVDLSVSGQREKCEDQVRNIAKQTKGKINWVFIDWKKFAKHGEKLGLSGIVVPAMAIEEFNTGKHFAFDENLEITTDHVSSWVNKYLDGTLQSTIKSDPIPESNDGPVKVVVAKSFNDIVLDTTRDVLVEFYAPWCGHCKQLAPIYEELGKSFQDISSVVIAKMDATTNEVDPKYGVKGYPTIKMFPADNKNAPIEYIGDRTQEDLFSFVKQEASIKFEASSVGKDEL